MCRRFVGEVRLQPFEIGTEQAPHALLAQFLVGPGADGERDVDSARTQRLVLVQGLVKEEVLPAGDEPHRDVRPLKGVVEFEPVPHGIVGVRSRQPFPEPLRAVLGRLVGRIGQGRAPKTGASRRFRVSSRVTPRSPGYFS